ncbi:MAG: 3'-5' exonuclease [Minicystis sp.]
MEREGIAADLLEREEPRHPSVRLATMHRIKGLEFPVVFVVGVSDGEVPYRSEALSSSDPVVAAQTELAERCLLYVAASRARDALYVSFAGEPSVFLAAMGAPPPVPVPKAVTVAPPAPVPRAVTVAPPAPVSLPEPELVSLPETQPEPVSLSEPEPEQAILPEPVRLPETELVSLPETEPAAAPPAVPEAPMPVPGDWLLIDERSLPARLVNWADRKGITTLRQLARIAPAELLAERNLGRRSVAETRAVIEERLGAGWEELAAAARAVEEAAAKGTAEPAVPSRWDELRIALPEALRGVGLDEIDLPTRVRSYAEREGLRTLADLAGRSGAQLRAAQNLGRKSVEQIFEAVIAFQERAAARRRLADAGLLESWKTLLLEQESVPRMVLTLRAGLGGRAEKLQAIGEMLGVSRERIRQIEARVLEDLGREKVWLAAVRVRVDEVLREGAAPLEALAADPWWAGIVAQPEALDFLGERLLGGAMRVVQVEERAYLARCGQEALDEAWAELRKSAGQVPLPAPMAAFRALVVPVRERIGAVLSDLLFERLRGLLHVEETSAEPRVTAVGDTQAAAILAMMRASPVPMRVEELWARLGRGHPPEEVMFFGHGVVGLEQHFPDFAVWMDRLVPAAVRVMERDAPERQWLASELREELREEIEIPEWLTDWHLGSLLRKSGKVRYLGRNRVALLDVPDGQGRVLYHEELIRILRERGEPMPREELVGELRKKTSVADTTVNLCLTRPQFLRCSADRFGLTERDLPGGAEARAEAAEHVATLLEHRERGLGAMQLWAEVARLGPAHAQWTPEMCLSVLRGDARFRLSQAGAVGLASWESVRVPARRELVGQCLEEAGGRVSVEAVQRRIEAYYGEAPGRVSIGQMANRFGAVLRGEWIERDTDARPADESG